MSVRRRAVILAAGAAAAGGLAYIAAVEGGEPRLAEAPRLVAPVRPAPEGLIGLDGDEGLELLFGSEAHAAFLPLMGGFETQRSPTHCGVATLAMVLNALGVPAPASTDHPGYHMFTQHNVLNARTAHVTDEHAVARHGMSLDQIADALRAYEVSAEARLASGSSVEAFRAEAIDHLGTEGRHVVVNYSRVALGQEGAGHISPLAAYDADTDRFLILDVSRYKAPAVWVKADQLFAAMAEPTEGAGTRTRGYVLVSRAGS